MDTTTANTLFEVGKKLFNETLKTSPSEGNGYGLALGVLVLVAIYLGINSFLERRDAKRYRSEQDKKADKRESEQDKKADKRESDASKRAIDEQKSRDEARERVIEEQRKHRDELRESFRAALAPFESRIGALEQREREHSEQIILLKAKDK